MPSVKTRFKRLLADLIDWNLIGLLILPLFALVVFLGKDSPLLLLAIPLFLAFPAGFVLRDMLCKGRSPGKRIFGLIILDRRSLADPTPNQLSTANMLALVIPLEPLILLTTGSTLGDRAAGTLVVTQSEIPAEPLPRRTITDSKRVILTLVIWFLLFIATLVGGVLLALNQVKQTPEYEMAYSYLISSEYFTEMGWEESDIRLTGYSGKTEVNNGISVSTRIYSFQIKEQTLKVICHPEGNSWQVCRECTEFQ